MGAKVSSAADRGKSAEKEVKKLLDVLDKRAKFAWYRLPDARSGSRAPTLADFLIMDHNCMILLEAKEVAHDFRLPYKNFAVDKVARMRKFIWAGSRGVVWVYHSTTDLWRCIPGHFFFERDMLTPSGSWDLSGYETHSELIAGMLCP